MEGEEKQRNNSLKNFSLAMPEAAMLGKKELNTKRFHIGQKLKYS